jgi:hypothetical protein
VLRPLNMLGEEKWWAAAGQDDIAQAWQHARAWEHEDPVVRLGADRLRRGLAERYGIDVDALTRDDEPDAVQRAMTGRGRGEQARQDAEEQRAQARREQAEADQLVQDADRSERAEQAAREQVPDERQRALWDLQREEARVAGEWFRAKEAERIASEQAGSEQAAQAGSRAAGAARYDSAERRENLAASLEGVADEETIQARLVADTNQARPAHEAVTSKQARVPKARPRRGPSGRGPQVQRGGPER